MELIIKKKNEKSFKGSDGSMVMYFWYKAFRPSDGVTLTFGSTNGEHRENTTVDLEIEKTESVRGYQYKEVLSSE